MEYRIEKKVRLLRADEIECRVGTINSKGCSLLLFKDARVDQKILDETYGVGFWKRNHKVIKENLYCSISVWNDAIKEWVEKEDVGTESYTEKEKGEASDSFKRAGFNWGIGRELYTSPFIWIKPNNDLKPYQTREVSWNEKDKKEEWNTTEKEFYPYKLDQYHNPIYTTKTIFKVSEIGYNENREINKLIITDHKGNIRFEMMPLEESKEKMLSEPIHEGEIQILEMMLEDTNTNLQDFLEYFKVDSIEKLTFKNYLDAEKILQKKKK